jgi:hypothetical protein
VRLKLEIPGHFVLQPLATGKDDGPVTYEVVPGVSLTLDALRPTPPDLRAWGDGVVLAGVDRSMYRVRNVEDLQTMRGWPVSLFFSDIISILPESTEVLESSLHAPLFFNEPGGRTMTPPSGPTVLERRLHALYLFGEMCGVAVARSKALARFDAALPELRRLVLTGEPDWKSDRVLALTDLWRGLAVTE